MPVHHSVMDHQKHLQALESELHAKVSQTDRIRALGAFACVLDAASIDAWSAAQGQFNLEAWTECGMPEDDCPTEADRDAGDAWRTAVAAARVELCDKAPFVSREAFDLVDFLKRDPKDIYKPVFSLV